MARATRLANSGPALFALFAGMSLVLRLASFGHPNIDGDEAFYFLVGRAMHDGLVPYVDIWDRKPIGLFAIYYLIAGVSDSVVAYQIAAALFAGATAAVIALIARRWSGPWGALLAGAAYLLLLPVFWGFGGQAPVFYNLFVALAALLVLDGMPALREGRVPWRAWVAMASCGIAIAAKQTALFEAVFMGLAVAVPLYRSAMPPRRYAVTLLALAATGAAPTLAGAAWYWLAGYWAEYWQAMVLSNLAKLKPDGVTVAARSLELYFRLAPVACAALLGLVVGVRREGAHGKGFVVGWLAAATIGFLAVPNFYMHYALPLLVPVCIAAAMFFARRDLGPIAFAVVAGMALHWFNPFTFGYTRTAREAVASMTESIRDHDPGDGLFVFDGPPLLYALAGKPFPSPLVLPMHFNYIVERNVSHLDTRTELARVLANGPGVVVMPVWSRNPRNEDSWNQVLAYVGSHCRLVDVQVSHDYIASGLMAIYGDCNPRHPPQTKLLTERR